MRDEELRAEFAEWLRPVREADPPRMPVIRRRLRRRRTRNAAAGTVALAVAAAAVFALPSLTGRASRPQPPAQAPSATTSPNATAVPAGYQSSAAFTITSPLHALVVSAGLGQVSVTGSQRSTVSVTEQIRYSAAPPVTTRSVKGRTLTLGYSCPAGQSCSIDYDVQVPSSIAVQVTLQAGTITLSRLAGRVMARTGTGAISALDLRSRTVTLRTVTGVIDAGFTAPPDSLLAGSQDGAINIGLPGTVSYQVIAQSTDCVINVQENTSSRHVIAASSGAGAITVVPGAPATSPSQAMGAGTAAPGSFPPPASRSTPATAREYQSIGR
jgi:hypothetical protein